MWRQKLDSFLAAHVLAVVLCFILSAVCLRAEETSDTPQASEGEKLERQMAADIKAKNWNAVESKIADGFRVEEKSGRLAVD